MSFFMESGFVTRPMTSFMRSGVTNMQNGGLRCLEAFWASRYGSFIKNAIDAVDKQPYPPSYGPRQP